MSWAVFCCRAWIWTIFDAWWYWGPLFANIDPGSCLESIKSPPCARCCQSSVKIIQSSGSFLKSPRIMMAIFVNRAVGWSGPSRKHLQIMFVYLWTRPHILIIYNICHGQKRVGDRDLKFIVNFLSKHFSSAHFVRYKKCFNYSWIFGLFFRFPFADCASNKWANLCLLIH